MNNNTNCRRNFLSKMLVTSLNGVALLSTSSYVKNNTVVLTEEQKDMLFFIYQEEKVA